MKKTVLLGALLLFLFPCPGFSQTVDLCEGNFDCDGDVDGTDAAIFKEDFGRSPFREVCPPCEPATTTITTTILEPRFIDNGDGTVTDSDSNLVWLKNSLCDELNNTGNGLNWYDATTVVGNLASGSCGLTDDSSAGEWRLPIREEWEQFVCNHYTEPAICNTPGQGSGHRETPSIMCSSFTTGPVLQWNPVPTMPGHCLWTTGLCSSVVTQVIITPGL